MKAECYRLTGILSNTMNFKHFLKQVNIQTMWWLFLYLTRRKVDKISFSQHFFSESDDDRFKHIYLQVLCFDLFAVLQYALSVAVLRYSRSADAYHRLLKETQHLSVLQPRFWSVPKPWIRWYDMSGMLWTKITCWLLAYASLRSPRKVYMFHYVHDFFCVLKHPVIDFLRFGVGVTHLQTNVLKCQTAFKWDPVSDEHRRIWIQN